MKTILKRITPFILSVEILAISFFTCSVSVYAADFMPHDIVEAVKYGIEYNDWDPFWRFLYETPSGLMYLYSQMGAFTTKDFCKWVDNNKALESLVETVPVPAKKEDNNIVFTKEFMAQLKALLDEYTKTEQTKEENGGFYLFPTTSISDVPADRFLNAQQFRTFRNIVIEKSVLAVRVVYEAPIRFVDPFSDPEHPILLVGSLSDLNRLEDYPYMPVSSEFFCANDWNTHSYRVQIFPEQDKIYTSVSEGVDYETGITYNLYQKSAYMNWDFANHGSLGENFTLYSTTGEYIRVFVSQNAAKNYNVGNRKVYFTENYYNYVPEDLSVSIDDLQKTVDDLQKVIDELLKQIGNNISEKEIMDLLKQILEELRNQQGGGNEGGGDVNIDIDLSTTNSWLSKIYAKVSQIFDKMSDGPDGTGGSILQKGLDSILVKLDELSGMLKKYLSEITGDLDDIKGQLENMTEQEFDEKSDSFLKDMVDMFSEIADVAKGKFPFSIPNDIRILLERIAITPSEPAALYSEDMSGVSVYSDDHRGGSASRDDETDSPGGGGASRPGTGFIDVEHGGDGGSKEPVESKNGAPVFRLPIVIERYHIEEYIVIDMSPFEPVSRMSRSLFMIMYVICLYNLTFKVMGLWGDLVG